MRALYDFGNDHVDAAADLECGRQCNDATDAHREVVRDRRCPICASLTGFYCEISCGGRLGWAWWRTTDVMVRDVVLVSYLFFCLVFVGVDKMLGTGAFVSDVRVRVPDTSGCSSRMQGLPPPPRCGVALANHFQSSHRLRPDCLRGAREDVATTSDLEFETRSPSSDPNLETSQVGCVPLDLRRTILSLRG